MLEGEDAPEVCPKCGAKKEAFNELSENEKNQYICQIAQIIY